MNMRIESDGIIPCANCNVRTMEGDVKVIRVEHKAGFTTGISLCKNCRKELFNLLAEEFADAETCVNYNRDGDYCERTGNACNKCTEAEVDETEDSTMEPIIIVLGEMNNFEPATHGYFCTKHAVNDILPKVERKTGLQVHTVYVDYATNDVNATMHNLMKELNKLGFGRITLNEIKKEPIHVDHATQIIPDEVYNLLPDFLKEVSLDGFKVTIKVNIETYLSFDELMTKLEQDEPDVFYSEIDSNDEAEKAINNMVIGAAGAGKSVKEFAKKIESVKETPTFQDFYNELCKMDSPEAHEFTIMRKLMQECRSKQNNNKNERANMCSSYRESDGKCNDTGKGCDGCASHYEIQNQKELLGSGKGFLANMPGIGVVDISKGQPIYGCKHCNSGFEDDDFAFALETGICQYCHKSLCK